MISSVQERDAGVEIFCLGMVKTLGSKREGEREREICVGDCTEP